MGLSVFLFCIQGKEIMGDFVFALEFIMVFCSFITCEPSKVAIQVMENIEMIGWKL